MKIMGKNMQELAEKIGVGNISYKLFGNDSAQAIVIRCIDSSEVISVTSGPINVIQKHWNKL